MWGVVVTACVVFSFLNKPADSWNVDWNAYVLHPLLEPFSVILASPEQYKIECLTYDSLIKMPLVCVYLKDLPSFNVCVFFFFFGELLQICSGYGGCIFDVCVCVLMCCCRCAQDMVEVPSHLWEHFVTDTRTLQLMARHHSSGQPIPLDLCEQVSACLWWRRRQIGTEC
jgi:hypothetical protein